MGFDPTEHEMIHLVDDTSCELKGDNQDLQHIGSQFDGDLFECLPNVEL